MLVRRSLALGRTAAQQQPLVPAGARNMATLRELELRLKSVRNIEKITKASGVDLEGRGCNADECYSL